MCCLGMAEGAAAGLGGEGTAKSGRGGSSPHLCHLPPLLTPWPAGTCVLLGLWSRTQCHLRSCVFHHSMFNLRCSLLELLFFFVCTDVHVFCYVHVCAAMISSSATPRGGSNSAICPGLGCVSGEWPRPAPRRARY